MINFDITCNVCKIFNQQAIVATIGIKQVNINRNIYQNIAEMT